MISAFYIKPAPPLLGYIMGNKEGSRWRSGQVVVYGETHFSGKSAELRKMWGHCLEFIGEERSYTFSVNCDMSRTINSWVQTDSVQPYSFDDNLLYLIH